jgi:Organic solute transporter Ostalpha
MYFKVWSAFHLMSWSARAVPNHAPLAKRPWRGRTPTSHASNPPRRLSSTPLPRPPPLTHALTDTHTPTPPPPQDWLICVEMLLAAIAHQRAFTYKDYVGGDERDGEGGRRGGGGGGADAAIYHAFLLSTLPRDLFSDLKRVAQGRMVRALARAHLPSLHALRATSTSCECGIQSL